MTLAEQVFGPQQIADLCGVEADTVKKWRQRGVLPTPDAVISGVPLWWRTTAVLWADRTGRLPEEDVDFDGP